MKWVNPVNFSTVLITLKNNDISVDKLLSEVEIDKFGTTARALSLVLRLNTTPLEFSDIKIENYETTVKDFGWCEDTKHFIYHVKSVYKNMLGFLNKEGKMIPCYFEERTITNREVNICYSKRPLETNSLCYTRESKVMLPLELTKMVVWWVIYEKLTKISNPKEGQLFLLNLVKEIINHFDERTNLIFGEGSKCIYEKYMTKEIVCSI